MLIRNPKMVSKIIRIILVNVESTPCTFVTNGQQITYGVRGNTIHFRVVLTGIPPTGSGWTAIGFGNSMVRIHFKKTLHLLDSVLTFSTKTCSFQIVMSNDFIV